MNKLELLQQHRLGAYIAVASAIKENLQKSDPQLLTKMRCHLISKGTAQHVVLDAAVALKTNKMATPEDLDDLRRWLGRLPEPEDYFALALSQF